MLYDNIKGTLNNITVDTGVSKIGGFMMLLQSDSTDSSTKVLTI